ncbi:aldehyde dehydrogenase [Cytobacillus horneckiae]|uniref:Aldehyde dehydrogenase n=1 Tax=Cytobacillus horneckiae TaxID=549687 RepID=A0A2N0ZC89_9BACI|nr:aldehyde dehydrogenase [Cytobacillus horneckiae]MEC1155898.1 aldehyde dehydrogenase [Cytobacillus horneckiae]MED2939826.1 aldehyde dehydrogenase [Cytobacillus horneckiae]PKG27126.1 aldehyde dehydrogenase [Cytobacillus horneckiae]
MEKYKDVIQKQRLYFSKGETKELSFRISALEKLQKLIKTHEQDIMVALKEDLNKTEFDSYLTEIAVLIEEIKFTLKNIQKWAKPRKVKSSLSTFGSKSFIYPEPYGVTLIISPWNYPFQLAMAPLIGSIAAGNTAIIKPSELTPHTSALMANLIGEYFPEEYISVVEGGIEISDRLLAEKWDYIFFTGSVPVGRIIMQAAAKHLTPVTLELGGKSPAIVHEDAHLTHAAKRLVWGKFVNAGQTCVAPDYTYVHSNIKELFIAEVKKAIKDIYTSDPMETGNFTKIVSDKHFHRLTAFLNNGQLEYGGRTDTEKRMIEPTILNDISWSDPIMEDEIFGPILPILEYSDLDSIIMKIKDRPKPLALYLFTESDKVQEAVLKHISFGGGCINDTVLHLSSPHLPFGGVGDSGMGAYHGKGSFDIFSHEKSMLKQSTKFDLPFRYPSEKALNTIKKLIK